MNAYIVKFIVKGRYGSYEINETTENNKASSKNITADISYVINR